MKFNHKNRRGELTTKQLVIIIILIASFIIVLFLLFRLNLGETTNKEICHNSVVLRGRSPLGGSLDCRTNYLCISGGEDCEGISATSTIEVDPNKEETKNETMKALADEMSDCWWMFGEGKIQYGKGFASTSVHCAICSVVEFDERVQGQVSEISYSEFYNYLRTTSKSSSQTYLQYLYDINEIIEIEDSEYFNFDLNQGPIDTTQRQSIITGVDMNVKVLFIGNDDRYLSTFIIPTSETSATKCAEFITKA